MRSKLLLLLLVLVPLFSASSARADELYAFSFTTTGGPDFGTPIQSFSFSFTVPTFVVANNATLISTFTPFNITDGSTTWTITQALAGTNSFDCFLFGSAGTTLNGSGCGGSVPAGAALLRFSTGTFVYPTTTGTFSDQGAVIAFGNNNTGGVTTGIWSLVVSDVTRPTTVPEPSSLLLLASGAVGMLGLKRRHRKSA